LLYGFNVKHLLDRKELMTPVEVARYLGLRPRTVVEWLREGKLPGIKLQCCRQWRVNPEHLYVWEKQQEK